MYSWLCYVRVYFRVSPVIYHYSIVYCGQIFRKLISPFPIYNVSHVTFKMFAKSKLANTSLPLYSVICVTVLTIILFKCKLNGLSVAEERKRSLVWTEKFRKTLSTLFIFRNFIISTCAYHWNQSSLVDVINMSHTLWVIVYESVQSRSF